MGVCLSKPRKPKEDEVDLFILKPRPSSFGTLSVCSSTQQNPSILNNNGKCPYENPCNKSYEATVESLLSYLYSIFNRRCPHCKKQIKPCARTKLQISSVFTTFQEKVILMKGESTLSSSRHLNKLPSRKFATIRKSCHEKHFLSPELQSSLPNIFDRPVSNDNVLTQIIFKSKELRSFCPDYDEVKLEVEVKDSSIPENSSYHYSDGMDYDYLLQPVNTRQENVVDNVKFEYLKFWPTEDTGNPVCLSQKDNRDIWG